MSNGLSLFYHSWNSGEFPLSRMCGSSLGSPRKQRPFWIFGPSEATTDLDSTTGGHIPTTGGRTSYGW